MDSREIISIMEPAGHPFPKNPEHGDFFTFESATVMALYQFNESKKLWEHKRLYRKFLEDYTLYGQ